MPSERDPYKSMGVNPRAPANSLHKIRHRSNPGKIDNGTSLSTCANCNKPFSLLESDDLNYCSACASLQIECSECGRKFIPKGSSSLCHDCELKKKHNVNYDIDDTSRKVEKINSIADETEFDLLDSFEAGDFRSEQLNKPKSPKTSFKKSPPNISFDLLLKEYKFALTKIVIFCINESNLPLNVSETVKILRGVKSEAIINHDLDQLSSFASLSHCSSEWMENFIYDLVSLDILKINSNDGNKSLELGKTDLNFVHSNKKDKNDLNEYDQELYEELRTLRKQIASEKKYPAYMICHNKTLEEMALKKPKNDKSMLEIKGVGVKFLENYGLAFQKVIKDYNNKTKNTKPDVPIKNENSDSSKSKIHHKSLNPTINTEDILHKLLYSSNASERSHTAHILGETKDTKYLEALRKATLDEDVNVRKMAASALGNLGDKKAETTLIKLLSDENPLVRKRAVIALGEIGSENSLPGLRKLLNDPKPYIQKHARNSIKSIMVR